MPTGRSTTSSQNKPPPSERKANAVAAHLVKVPKAPSNKKFERRVRDQWRSLRWQAPDKNLPPDFSTAELDNAMRTVKAGTAPGYNNIHPEFLLHLGFRACCWLYRFFCRIPKEDNIPKIWRKAKVIAIEKPGKDPNNAANYQPISLLSVCCELLECLCHPGVL